MNRIAFVFILIGFLLSGIAWRIVDKIGDQIGPIIRECEKTLPRDQECELIALPRFKADK